MNVYYFIFTNSLHAAFMLLFGSENAWFAARAFGNYNMFLTSLAAFTGSMLGMVLNFGVGYYLAHMPAGALNLNEAGNTRAGKIFRRYVVWILLFPWVPFLGLFGAFAGLFRVTPARALAIIAAGRVFYYGYYCFF